jgi:hypothetical protein
MFAGNGACVVVQVHSLLLHVQGHSEHGRVTHAVDLWTVLHKGVHLQALSHEVAAHLGLQLGAIRIKKFADGEIYVQVLESIRGCDVFLLQATCPTQSASVNDSLMELMVMVDACRCSPLLNRSISSC